MNTPPTAKLYIEGRYLKHYRGLPQTVFFCPECKGHPRRRRKCEKCEGFGKLTKDSVQELIGWVIGKAAGTRKNKFHGAGREDVDVRMLGDGRPFVFELVAPKSTSIDLAELEATINSRNEGRLEVRGLHWTQKGRIRFLKEGKFGKEYRARVELDAKPADDLIEGVVGLRYEIAQQTPSRVAHRRADKVRERWIEVLAVECDPDDERFVDVTLRTQAGTYVKEAISGEGGMSKPSIAELLGAESAQCVTLDVLAILDEDGEEPEEIAAETQSPFGSGLGGSGLT